MFSTREAFKLPFKLEPGLAYWSIVEVEPGIPWFIVRVYVRKERQVRCFALSDLKGVLDFTSNLDVRPIVGLTLVLPPHFSKDSEWQMLPIQSLHAIEAEDLINQLDVLMITKAGERYAGFPLSKVSDDVELVQELWRLDDPETDEAQKR